MIKKYSISLDVMSKILSLMIVVFMIFVFVNIFDERNFILALSIFCLFSSIFAVAILYKTQYYELDSEYLKIYRLINRKKIKLTQISKVRTIEEDEMVWTIRLFGTGGFMGYTGYYWNKKIGTMIFYSSRRDRSVLVSTYDNKNYILSPDDSEFVNDIQNKIEAISIHK